MDKGEDMIIRARFLFVILPILLLQISGIVHAESDITKVFKYEFPVAYKRLYKSHTVTFSHSRHAMELKITCVRCHHTLEPGAVAVEDTCRDCHGAEARRNQPKRPIRREERVLPYLIALHDMCADCHKAVKKNNPDVGVPLACWRCHVRQKK